MGRMGQVGYVEAARIPARGAPDRRTRNQSSDGYGYSSERAQICPAYMRQGLIYELCGSGGPESVDRAGWRWMWRTMRAGLEASVRIMTFVMSDSVAWSKRTHMGDLGCHGAG